MPLYDDVYSPMKNSWNLLRNVYFIKSLKEKEIGIGDDYNLEPVNFGECYVNDGYTYNNTIEHFKFPFDYFNLAKQYN